MFNSCCNISFLFSRIGRVKTIVICSFFWTIFALAAAFVPNYIAFVALRFCVGALAAGAYTTSFVICEYYIFIFIWDLVLYEVWVHFVCKVVHQRDSPAIFLRKQQWCHLFGCETHANRAITTHSCDYFVYLCNLAVHKYHLPHHRMTS